MTKDEKIAFTEKYRAQYDAAYAQLGSKLREWSVDGGLTWHKKQDATTMVRNYDIHIDDAYDSIRGILCNVTSPESHAAFIPTTLVLAPNARMVEERDAARAELKTYKMAIRRGITHPPLSGDCHMIWWPDNQPVPSFGESGETHQVIELLEAIAALTAERDAALAGARIGGDSYRAQRDNILIEAGRYCRQINKLTDDNSAMGATNERLRDEITALTAEKNHLHDQLAKFTAANVPEPEPAKPNPFRDFPNDPRRVGR